MYLKFVWGRSKIPQDVSHLSNKHRICVYDHMDPQSLPRSHTCFFTIDLPEYKEFEIMDKRIRYAIETCGEIDDDGGVNPDD